VGLRVIGDEFFFSISPKFLDWDTVLGTLGDALTSDISSNNVKTDNVVSYYVNFDWQFEKTT
jgi:hypothetical protein